MWNIHDLTAFNNRQPIFTRSWIQKLQNKRRERKKRGGVGFKAGTKGEESLSPSPVRSPDNRGPGLGSAEEGMGQSDYSSSDDEYKGKGVTLKGASQWLSYKPQDKKNDAKNKNFIEEYYKKIQRLAPQIDKGRLLKQTKERLNIEFKQKYKNNNNAFLTE